MDMTGQACIAVVTTVACREDARRIATALLESRLAACVQLSEIESHYRWKGELCHEPEIRVLAKTVADRYAAVEAAIREAHPYELPAIHALPFAAIEPGYAAWVRGSVGAGEG